jgi:copper chaperone CopZ
MTPTQNGTHRTQLLGITPTVSPAASPVLSPNPYATTNPAQVSYSESQYSQSEGLQSQPEEHRPSPPRTFLTNGVKYPSPPPEPAPEEAARPVPNIESPPELPTRISAGTRAPVSAGTPAPVPSGSSVPVPSGSLGAVQPAASAVPSGVRFAEPGRTPTPPWKDCPYPHVLHPSGEVIRSEAQSAPTSKPISKTPAMNHHPFGALSSCCATGRPGTPPRTNHGHSHSHSHSSGICCSESHRSSEDSSLKYLGDSDEKTDLELGPANFQRTVLRIDGLKCGCCEGGLSRALSRIPAIRDYQVNVVLARVEFELDTNRLSADDVIKLLETRTGYNFEEQVTLDGQVLEFIVTDPRRLKFADQPYGVIRIEVPERAPWRPLQLLSGRNSTTPRNAMDAEKDDPPQATTNLPFGHELEQDTEATEGANQPRIARGLPVADSGETKRVAKIRIPPTKVLYDANKIGARDVYEHYLKHDPDLRLAPLAAHPGLELGAKQTRRALRWFLPTLALTIPVIVLAWAPVDHTEDNYAHVSLALATIVQLIAIKEFVPSALRSLYHSYVFEMDFLIASSTTIAYIFSVVSYAYQIKVRCLLCFAYRA